MAEIHDITNRITESDVDEFGQVTKKLEDAMKGHKLHVVSAAICWASANITVQLGKSTDGDPGGDFVFFIREFADQYVKLVAPHFDED